MAFPSAGCSSNSPHGSFEIKSANLRLVALMVKTSDWKVLFTELSRTYGPKSANPDFFEQDALVIDFSEINSDEPVPNFEPLMQVLKSCGLLPVAVRGVNSQWKKAALEIGLVEGEIEAFRSKPVIHENVRQTSVLNTMVIDKPVRSGQKVYAKGTDLVLLAMVNQGAEVVADGNIHVYAPLRGKAMAGARGNTQARIFSLCMEPELVSIAGVYRTSENRLDTHVHGKAAQVRLSDDGQEKLLFEALKT